MSKSGVCCKNDGISPKQDPRASDRVPLACALILMLLASAHTMYAQISPGPLAKAHQAMSGGTNCTKCHEVSTRAPSFHCVECHKEIAAELHENRGLHATF